MAAPVQQQQQHQQQHPLLSGSRGGTSTSLLAAERITPLQEILPIGVSDPPLGRFAQDPDHLWSVGLHPDTTPAQRLQFASMLKEMWPCFAHTTAELTGYKGRQ